MADTNILTKHYRKSSSAGDFATRVLDDGDFEGSDTRTDLINYYDDQKKLERKNNPKSTETSAIASAATGTAGFVSNANKSMMGSQFQNGVQGEFKSAEFLTNLVYDSVNNKFRELTNLGEGGIAREAAKMAGDEILLQLQQEYSLHRQINQETSLTGKISKHFRQEIMNAYPDVLRLGIGFEDLAKSMTQMVQDAGRFKLLDEETIESLAGTSAAFFDNISDGMSSLAEFQKVSRGATDTVKTINEIGLDALKLGLNAKETVKVLTENISALNRYGFENGEKGLAKMIKQAQVLRMDIRTTFDIAEKLFDPTQALDLAANMQVIGGALGDLNDPIKMMWMATNDVEGLQDALVGSFEALTSFDDESQTFKIIGADLRRARAMSDELGMSLDELTNAAVQSAQRTAAATDLMSTGLQMDEDDREFLTNLSQMEGGKMTISVPENIAKKMGVNNKIALEELTQGQYEQLKAYQTDLEKIKTPEDIARQQVGLMETISRDLSFLVATARVEGGAEVKKIAKAWGFSKNAIDQWSKETGDTLAEEATEWIQKKGEKIREGEDPNRTSPQPNTQGQQNQTQPNQVQTQQNQPKQVYYTVRIMSDSNMDDAARKHANEVMMKTLNSRAYTHNENLIKQ